MYIVFTILICIIKLTEKPTVFHQADFCERLMYLYKSRTKKVSDENSVIEHGI